MSVCCMPCMSVCCMPVHVHTGNASCTCIYWHGHTGMYWHTGMYIHMYVHTGIRCVYIQAVVMAIHAYLKYVTDLESNIFCLCVLSMACDNNVNTLPSHSPNLIQFQRGYKFLTPQEFRGYCYDSPFLPLAYGAGVYQVDGLVWQVLWRV